MVTQTLPAGQLNCKAIEAMSSEVFRAQALAALLTSAAGLQALDQLDESFRVALFAVHADQLKRIRSDMDNIVEQADGDERVIEAICAADNYLAEAEAVADMMIDPDAIQRLIAHATTAKVAIAAGHAAHIGNVLTIVDRIDA